MPAKVQAVLLWRTKREGCFAFKNIQKQQEEKEAQKRGKCNSLLTLKRLNKPHGKKSERMRYGISKMTVKM